MRYRSCSLEHGHSVRRPPAELAIHHSVLHSGTAGSAAKDDRPPKWSADAAARFTTCQTSQSGNWLCAQPLRRIMAFICALCCTPAGYLACGIVSSGLGFSALQALRWLAAAVRRREEFLGPAFSRHPINDILACFNLAARSPRNKTRLGPSSCSHGGASGGQTTRGHHTGADPEGAPYCMDGSAALNRSLCSRHQNCNDSCFERRRLSTATAAFLISKN